MIDLDGLGLIPVVVGLECLPPASPRARQQLGRSRCNRHLALPGVLQPQRQPDVEGQHHIAALGTVDVPDVVT
jgi:hypothetical protein